MRSQLDQLHRLWRLSQEQGPGYALLAAAARFSKRLERPSIVRDPNVGLAQLLREYKVREPSTRGPSDITNSQAVTGKPQLRITWILPMAGGSGGGGTADVVHLASALSRRGHVNTLCFFSDLPNLPSSSEIRPEFEKWYGQSDVQLIMLKRPIHRAKIPESDVVVATAWPTAYIANQLGNGCVRAYFVQDYEPWFYPAGTESLLAEQTYGMDFRYLVLGEWLKQELSNRHGTMPLPVNFPVDRSIFYPREAEKKEKFRIAFYVRTATARRSFDLGILALHDFRQRVGEDVEIILFGDPALPHQAGCINVGALSRDRLATLYSSVDVVLSLSATNMSLIPHEAAACGAAIVELDLLPVRAHLTHGIDAYLVAPYPSAISDGLLHLYHDRELCRSIARGGQEAVKRLPSWDDVALAVEGLLRGDSVCAQG